MKLADAGHPAAGHDPLVLDEIPQTPTGRVQRRRMAAFVAGGGE
jgi:hypothetical protein